MIISLEFVKQELNQKVPGFFDINGLSEGGFDQVELNNAHEEARVGVEIGNEFVDVWKKESGIEDFLLDHWNEVKLKLFYPREEVTLGFIEEFSYFVLEEKFVLSNETQVPANGIQERT